MLLTIYVRGSNSASNSVFDCHLSPVEKSVSNDCLSTFVDSINVFDCRLSFVILVESPTSYDIKLKLSWFIVYI